MARKTKAFDIWRDMKPAALWRLALAVFLVFAVLGPIIVLMESRVEPRSWGFLIVETVASGGLAASIVLLGRKGWWVVILLIVFWSAILMLNAGALSIQSRGDGMRVFLQGTEESGQMRPRETGTTLSAEDLNRLYQWKGLVGLFAIGLLAFGYSMFISVVRSEVRQRARFETEVAFAQQIQESLQPSGPLETERYAAFGLTLPASEVGGDYFDIIRRNDDTLIAVVADVTGHGIGAGILSAMVKSALYMELEHTTDPAVILRRLNATIHALSDEKTFVTFALVVVDPGTGRVRAATAGHPPVLLRRSGAGGLEEIRTRGTALGMTQEFGFQSVELTCAKGDWICLYTDGIIEAANAKKEEFGVDRLKRLLSVSAQKPEEFCRDVSRQVKEFTGGGALEDDVTIVAVQING